MSQGRPHPNGPNVVVKKISGKSKSQKERDAEAMAKKVEKEEAKGGRIKWKDDETKKRNTALFTSTPAESAPLSWLPNFNGDWLCSATAGDWDELLKLLEVPEFTRKLAKAREWGVGITRQTIQVPRTFASIEIRNRSKKPIHTTTEAIDPASSAVALALSIDEYTKLDIDGESQSFTYHNHSGKGAARWEGTNLTVRFDMGKLGPVRCRSSSP